MVAGSLVPLNSTMIAVALPDVADHFDVRRGSTAFLVTAYLVAMLVFQPITGRLGDRYGTKRIAAGALAGFAFASLAAGAAPSFGTLLASRCVQAVFAAALIPNTQALLRATVAGERRGRAFGLVGSGIGAGAAIGPVIGGLLVGATSWRGIFLVNVPIIAAALALVRRSHAPELSAEADAPDLSARPLRQLSFLVACATNASSNFALYTALLVVPVVLDARDWSAGAVGVATSTLTLGMLVLAPVGGALSDRHGRTRQVIFGMGVALPGCLLLAAGVEAPAVLLAGMLVLGIGMGLANASLQAAALESVPPAMSGAAAGAFTMSRYVGSIIASVAIGALGVEAAGDARRMLVATVAAMVVSVSLAPRIEPRLVLADTVRREKDQAGLDASNE